MSAPIGHTCKSINQGIDFVDEVFETLKPLYDDFDSHTIGTIKDAVDSVLRLINPIVSKFEDLRSDNMELRSWGEVLEDKVDALEKELEAVRNEMEDLEQELEDIRADYHV